MISTTRGIIVDKMVAKWPSEKRPVVEGKEHLPCWEDAKILEELQNAENRPSTAIAEKHARVRKSVIKLRGQPSRPLGFVIQRVTEARDVPQICSWPQERLLWIDKTWWHRPIREKQSRYKTTGKYGEHNDGLLARTESARTVGGDVRLHSHRLPFVDVV